MTVRVPHAKKILWRFFKLGFENFVDMFFGGNLWQSEYYLGHYGNHKWGYSEKTLSDFLKHFGIETNQTLRDGFNIRLIDKKVKHISLEEVDKIQIFSLANKCGTGNASVSVGFAREKIKQYNTAQSPFSNTSGIR